MQEWIEQLVQEKYASASALAKAIGMTDSGFGRAVRAGTFDVENCLRLAYEAGESAKVVLERAGKTEINSLIESLYGEAATPDEVKAQKVYALFRACDVRLQELVLTLMRVHPLGVGQTAQLSSAEEGPT